MEPATKTIQVGDVRERELFERYARARYWKENLSTLKSQAEKDLDTAIADIVTYLTDCGKKSTGKYDDIGSLTVVEPAPRPKFAEEKRGEVYQFVRDNGGGACIKEGIHPGTFSSFIREKMSAGIAIPDCIEIYYQPQVKFFPAPKKAEE